MSGIIAKGSLGFNGSFALSFRFLGRATLWFCVEGDWGVSVVVSLVGCRIFDDNIVSALWKCLDVSH